MFRLGVGARQTCAWTSAPSLWIKALIPNEAYCDKEGVASREVNAKPINGDALERARLQPLILSHRNEILFLGDRDADGAGGVMDGR